MPFTIRAYPCEDCGQWTVRKRKSNDVRICVQCGLERRWYARTPLLRPTPYGQVNGQPPPKRRT